MDTNEQIQAFQDDLRAVIDRYRREFDLPFGAAIGVLEVVKLDLYRDQQEED